MLIGGRMGLGKGVNKLKSLTIRVSNELHKKIKFKTIEEETTIQDYVLKLIEKDLNIKKQPKNNK